MSYSVKPGNIWGRLGKSTGQALSEQVPKEVERMRLSQGLKDLEAESGNLTPTQYYTRALQVPGLVDRPQVVQSLGELAKQQNRSQALIQSQDKDNQPKPSPFPQQEKNTAPGSKKPSITQEKPLEKIQEGYIPPTQQEIMENAGRLYNENPALYGNDPQKAIDASEKSAEQDRLINEAYEKKHGVLTKLQDNVVSRLQNHSNQLGVKIPANAYSKIEDKAINAVKPKSQGGNGLTEQQAMKTYGEELDEVSRDYSGIDSIGNWGITGRKAKDTLSSLKSLQSKFEKRDDTENFGDSLISKNSLSPQVAYSIAEPVSREPALNKELSSLSPLKPNVDPKKAFTNYPREETLKISKQLAPHLGKKGSPLAVAYELEKLGYDSGTWLDYLVNNRDSLKLTENQGRQLDKPRNLIGTLNDWWLSSWSGLDKGENK